MADEEAGIFEQLKQAVMDGDEDAAVAAANAAVAAGIDPQKAIMEGLAAGMAEMGRLYEAERVLRPGTHGVVRSPLRRPRRAAAPGDRFRREAEKKGVAVIGAVQGDIHDIGKNLVKMMLEVSGIEVHDLRPRRGDGEVHREGQEAGRRPALPVGAHDHHHHRHQGLHARVQGQAAPAPRS